MGPIRALPEVTEIPVELEGLEQLERLEIQTQVEVTTSQDFPNEYQALGDDNQLYQSDGGYDQPNEDQDNGYWFQDFWGLLDFNGQCSDSDFNGI